MKPFMRPLMYALLGSIVGATCATLVMFAIYRDPSDQPDAFVDMPIIESETESTGDDQATAEDSSTSTEGTSTAEADGTETPGFDPKEAVISVGDVVDVNVVFKPGENLTTILLNQDVPRNRAYNAVEAMKDVFDPRSLRAGQSMQLSFVTEESGELGFKGLKFEPSVGVTIEVMLNEEGAFKATKTELPLTRFVGRYEGKIETTLSQAAADQGASQKALGDMIRAFSYDVDFQRDIKTGDAFEIFYEQMDTEDGRRARVGDVIYASLTLSGKKLGLYRFKGPDGKYDYYNEKGEGVRKALLRTPINGARLSSNFGLRKHPILGYSRMHKGIDFAAPTGTPIYAAGDGVIAKAEFNRGYGNHVRLRHNSEFMTVYAHMRNIAKGMKAGTRVKQGQVIGYVGTTGMSTGPHLHYEIIRNGEHVNPAATRFAASTNLTGANLKAFQEERERILALYKTVPSGKKVANAE